MHFSLVFSSSLLRVDPNIFLSTLFLKTLSLCYSFHATDQHNRTGETTILQIFNFKF
jgi:hypothetical protein